MERPLPPRWKRCPSNGQIIMDIFVPFKVPLDESYHSQLHPSQYFTPQMFIDGIRNLKKRIGLWIDLTNTSRFYDKEIIKRNHIEYFKLKCRGHSEAPNEEQVDAFNQKCSDFIESNPNSLIAVHCTHGFNRTGFLIASYLVTNVGWDVRAAIGAFARARPPGIYKQDYLDQLIRLYDEDDDDDDTPRMLAPSMPDWCNEDVQVQDDDAGVSNRPANGSIASNSNCDQVIASIPNISLVSDIKKIRDVRTQCSDLCKWEKRGFPGAQPVSLSRQNIQLLAQEEFRVSWKADGTRCMMLILSWDECYLFDRDYKVYQLYGVKFFQLDGQSPLVDTLLDGELVIDKVNNVDMPRYLIYDIVAYSGTHVGQDNFQKRLNILYKQIIMPRENAKRNLIIDRHQEPVGIRMKDFFDIEKTSRLLSPAFQRQLSHETDGLIFQPVEMAYTPGRCDRMLKWKPPSHNSIDFKLRVVRETRQGMLEDYIGELWVNGMDQPFGKIRVNKAIRELNGKIIECRYDMQRGWMLMRERTDKSFPNAFTTAENVMQTILHPLQANDLLSYIEHYGFKKPKM